MTRQKKRIVFFPHTISDWKRLSQPIVARLKHSRPILGIQDTGRRQTNKNTTQKTKSF